PGPAEPRRPTLGPGVRVDTHVEDGTAIPPHYDSLAAKVIVWDETRPAAIDRSRRALGELELRGIPTTREAALEILENESFSSGRYSTSFLEETPLAAVAQPWPPASTARPGRSPSPRRRSRPSSCRRPSPSRACGSAVRGGTSTSTSSTGARACRLRSSRCTARCCRTWRAACRSR